VVLSGLAAYLTSALRKADIIGRYGGEEFVAALVNTNPEQSRVAAERIRKGVSSQSFQTSEGPVSVTICIGVASLPKGEGTDKGSLDQLVDQADQAMYRAKRSGRNGVRFA
jgi:diguanylate cyclase (GGDEF)-like protein